ncbi:endoribonuclease L-PSP [Salpingoeca rosetta]|uniref:Endoribonuclease L-PSP n=1 Tax=Salpingoeca rosetta (strain ATCC 50818 / BSB-021) TaxID=946362 RepID=F2UES7_SALR5|nr:endoribonuclease L-PSP [Salpingoeca rosetta]EGD75127.1 endoribonuclease L-PSP [Salpingoeca rosetta]|eukprot:XP_004992180.1 endoribonuclease L-PSP [Salpingoeca rosetta]
MLHALTATTARITSRLHLAFASTPACRFPYTRAMSSLATVHTDKAPAAIGPYSQAVKANGMVYCSGQIPIDAATGELKLGSIADQTELVLSNLREVLKAAGSDMNQVVKTTVLLKDMNDFQAMNEVYGKAFGDHRPARAAYQVARLPKDVSVEIEAIAVVPE